MRLLSASATAAIITFVLLATLGGTAALAQEQSTRQAFQTREITGPEATPENTTQTPASEQRDAQASAGCPGATVIDTVGPTDDDLLIGPFRISGKSFRLTYETTDVDQSGLPFFDVTVLDAAGNEVGGRVIFKEGIQREIVRAGPGNFTIEARAEDLKYKLTAEDCTGGANPGPPNPPPGGSGGDAPATSTTMSMTRATSSTTRYPKSPSRTRAVCRCSALRPSGSSAPSPRLRSSGR